jgi:tetratricopeptide (TPR) repeat protein
MPAHPWTLVLAGKYQEAIEVMTKDLPPPSSSSAADYANRAAAYLCLRNYEAAAQDYETLIRVDPTVEKGYAGHAICQWCQNQPAEAIAYWKRALDSPYTDAAGGVKIRGILLYAGVRTRQPDLQKDALRLLRRRDRTKQAAMNWPGPIAGFLTSRLTKDQLYQSLLASVRSPVLQERYQCQAHFYIGIKSLLEGQMQTFKEEMLACSQSGNGCLEFEYYLAMWEVDHQFPDIAPLVMTPPPE